MQILAMVTMLIDHVGEMMGVGHDAWRVIGRIAMPIYCYFIVMGHQHTKNKKKYIARLLVIGLIAQIPYEIALGLKQTNIIFTFIISLLILIVMDKVKNKFLLVLIPIAGSILLEILPFEYGAYALLLILSFRYLKSHTLVAAHFVLNIIVLVYHGWVIELFSIFPTLILVYNPAIYRVLDYIKVKRWIWRIYYPAHLAVLAIVHEIIVHTK